MQHCLEDKAQRIALPKATVTILGESRVVGDFVLQTQATEPAIGLVEMDFFAESALGSDAKAGRA